MSVAANYISSRVFVHSLVHCCFCCCCYSLIRERSTMDKRNLRSTNRVGYSKLNSVGVNIHSTPHQTVQEHAVSGNREQCGNSENGSTSNTIALEALSESIRELENEERQLKLQLELAVKQKEVDKLKRALQETAPPSKLLERKLQTPPQTLHEYAAIDKGLLGDLLQSTTPNTEANNPLRLDLDPQAYLRKGNTTNNYRPIVNYIPRAANCEEEEVEIAAGVSIKLKSSATTKLENVTPAQWTVANARILAKLLDDTPASDTKRVTLDYLSHTAKMGELATRYTWSSVILLDDEYRRQQAAYGFRWGSDTPHMSVLVLREREKQKHRHPRSTIKPQERPVCHMYNSGKTCTYGKECCFSCHVLIILVLVIAIYSLIKYV